MREVKKVEIDGTFYAITPLDPIKSVKMLARLVKAYGGPLKALILSRVNGGGDTVAPETIGQALDDLIQAIDPDDLEKLISELIKPEFVSYSDTEDGSFNKVISINAHFSKFPLMHLFKVIKAVLEVNYSDFLGGLVG